MYVQMATANIRPTTYRYKIPAAEPESLKIIAVSQRISRCIRFPDLFNVVLECALECSGAHKGFIFSWEAGELQIRSKANRESNDTFYVQALPKTLLTALAQDDIPTAIIQQVAEAGKEVIINKPSIFNSESKHSSKCSHPEQLLIFPIIHEAETSGIIYLENGCTQMPFSENVISMISVICEQAAISFQNVFHFEMLEEKVITQMTRVNKIKKELEINTCSRTDYLKSINGAIRSKLDDIIGFSQLIQRKEINKPLNNETRHYLEHIQESTQELSEFFENAFVFSDQFTAEESNLSEGLNPRLLIQSIYQSNRKSASKRSVIFSLKFKEPLPKVIYSDRNRINRILMSIISRTVQLSHQGETVDISMSATAKDLRIDISQKQYQFKTKPVLDQVKKNRPSDKGFQNGDSRPGFMEEALPVRAFFNFVDLDMIKNSIVPLKGRISTTTKPNVSSLTIYIPVNDALSINPQLVKPSSQTANTLRKIPPLLAHELLVDFKMLQSTPIYKGGTLCRIIRKAKRACEEYNSIYPTILDKIETAVFDGDKIVFSQLVSKLLTIHRQETESQ